MKNYWGTGLIFVLSLCLAGSAYAFGDGWGSAGSGVQESSGSGWSSSGDSISIEEVTYADSGILAADTQLYCLSDSLSSDKGWYGTIAVNDSEGDLQYVKGNEAWFVGSGSVSVPAVVMSTYGKFRFDKLAVCAENLMDIGIDSKEQAWGYDLTLRGVAFVATSGTFFEDYRTREGNFLGAKEADVYLFSTARVPIEEGGIVDVPNVITKFSNLEEHGDVDRDDCGFYENSWHYEDRAYYTVNDPDDMITRVELEDGNGAMVSIGQLSSVADSDKIAVLDAGGNTWYVDEGDIEENEDMEFLYEIFTQ